MLDIDIFEIPIIVITICDKRFSAFMKHVPSCLHANIVRFDGVNGRCIQINNVAATELPKGWVYKHKPFQTKMTRGQIGCHLSHSFVWEQIVHKWNRACIVLEDDVIFSDVFETLKDRRISLEGTDFLYLGRNKYLCNQTEIPPNFKASVITTTREFKETQKEKVVVAVSSKNTTVKNKSLKLTDDFVIPLLTWGLFAYVLNPASAKTLLGFCNKKVIVPCDILVSKCKYIRKLAFRNPQTVKLRDDIVSSTKGIL